VPLMSPEEEEQFNKQYEMYQQVAAENNFAHSVWSIYEVTDFAEVPYPNARVLHYPYSLDGQLIEVALKPDSTWLDLWRAADQAIAESKDEDHHFIELFEGDGEILELVTGS
jgi:hypothetical protein